MIDDDTLFGLGERLPPSGRGLSEIERRATDLTRRRRAGLLATAAAALAVVAVAAAAGLPLVRGQDRGSSSVPAVTPTLSPTASPTAEGPGGPGRCQEQGGLVSTRAGALIRWLPPRELTGEPDAPASFRRMENTCPPPAWRVAWYAASPDGRLTRWLDVTGPMRAGVQDEPGGGWQPMQGGEATRVGEGDGSLQFVTGTLSGHLEWTAPDGSVWSARASGLTRAELLAAAGSVSVRDGRIDAARTPTGLTTRWPAPEAVPPGPYVELRIRYPHDVSLSIRHDGKAARPHIPALGARPADIGGQPGWVQTGRTSPQAGQPVVQVDWTLPTGAHARLSGPISVESALRLARATAPVPAGDDRIGIL